MLISGYRRIDDTDWLRGWLDLSYLAMAGTASATATAKIEETMAMPSRNQRSIPERYPYHPIHHVESIIDSPDGGRSIVTNFKYPSGQPVRFYVILEKSELTVVTDRGEIAVRLGAERYGDGWGHHDDEFGYWRERYFSDAQIAHWHRLNYMFKTAFGDGPASAPSILAGGTNLDAALAKIIGATRNFIAVEVKGR